MQNCGFDPYHNKTKQKLPVKRALTKWLSQLDKPHNFELITDASDLVKHMIMLEDHNTFRIQHR